MKLQHISHLNSSQQVQASAPYFSFKNRFHSEVCFYVHESVYVCVQQQRGGESPYPVFPCGPHRATLVEVSFLIWFPPRSVHAALEEAESAASAYELTPSAGWRWVKYRWWQRAGREEYNKWHKQTYICVFITTSSYLLWLIVRLMTESWALLKQCLLVLQWDSYQQRTDELSILLSSQCSGTWIRKL